MLLEENHKFILRSKTNCGPICLSLLLLFLPEETDPKNILLRLMSKSILPMLSPRSFMISSLKFKF